MNIRKVTEIFILLLIFVAICFDFFAIAKGGTEASISHVIFVWTHKYPSFTFALGYLMGHLTWRIRDTLESKKISDSTRE